MSATSGHNRIRIRSSAGLLCVSLTVLAGFGAVGSAPSAPAGWRAVASTRTIFFPVVVAQSRRSAWALGGGFTPPQSGFPAGLHWNGRTWSKVGPASFPKAIRNTGIGCAGESSPGDLWAFAGTGVSGNGAIAAGALRLERGRWRLLERFPAGIVTGCLVESSTEIWVFGDAHVAAGVGTWHLHGRTWKQVISGRYALAAASAVRAGDVWAEGESGFLDPVVAHWNGRVWARNTKLSKALPKVTGTDELTLGGITATGHNDVWFRVYVIHNPGGRATYSAVVLHWNGRAWHKVGAAAFGYYLPGAVRDGHGGWWTEVIVSRSAARVLHAVRGRWFTTPVSIRGCRTGRLYQLAPVPNSTSVLGMQVCPSRRQAPETFNVLLNGPRL